MAEEIFLIRLMGGPHPGDQELASEDFEWPLPNLLQDDGGYYIKVSESVVRAGQRQAYYEAYYEWRPRHGGGD